MNFKSIMLAAAATAAAATTSQAADLPVAAEPVDYVKVCDAYGSRFYYIPGTDTCLRVGGRVRVQYTANDFSDGGNWGDSSADGYGAYGRGYLYLDSRTATEFGLLRTFTEFSGRSDTGFSLGAAYVQFGGFTFGYATSNFDYFTGTSYIGVAGRNWSDTTVEQVAYTQAFGNGFSATVALEDAADRQVGDYDGVRYPDLVAKLRVDQGWGSAQLMGALHNTNVTGQDSEFGFAVGGGVTFGLPMISEGTELAFQAVYVDGALSYIAVGDEYTVNGVDVSISDAANGDTSSGYALGAGLYHQATATVGLALDGSYADIETGDDLDLTRYAVNGSVQWEPVSGLSLGANLGYSNVEIDSQDEDALLAAFRVQRTF
ncbi:porin [Roseibium limicola]|uniref:Porin n=1 Tax=Roseibium limicola TaxID=2816037 RepID=A0A939ENA2_9HYPH|nr:porin [Roseibium limicola]MBO0345017.1 porin [Roseibium limicola]